MDKNRNIRTAVGVCLLILAMSSISPARTIHVDDDGPADFSTIQAAIDDANNGDTVLIHPGAYTGPGNRDITIESKAITVQSTDPNDPCVVAATVIDCGGTSSDLHGGFRLLNYYGNVPDSVLAGLTVTEAYAHRGGGIECHGGATIRKCRITGNHALRGGGVYVSGGAPKVLNCVIAGNSVSRLGSNVGLGGGIYCEIETALTMSDCLIVGNSASGSKPEGNNGGGIFIGNSGDAIIRHCTIAGNTADVGGGILCDFLATITVADSIVWSNTASRLAQISGTPSVIYSDVEGGWTGLGNIDVDPQFTGPASNDYHLASSSPCIDAGDPLYVPYSGQTDIDNDPRVMGRCPDIGGDEFRAVAAGVLDVEPLQLVFHADADGLAPEPQVVHVRNAGYAPLTLNVAEDCPWITISEASPPSFNGSHDLILNVDMAELSPGCYDYPVMLTADDVPNSPQAVAVTLCIRAGRYLGVPQPYRTIQSAVETAQNGDTIIVESGTYTGPGNRDIDFLGKAITVRGRDPTDPAVVATTIIDCGGLETDRHRGFVFRSHEDANSVLSGLTITRGQTLEGAGICIYASSPTILLCDIVDNICASAVFRESYSGKHGGGIYIREGSPRIEQCLIANNRCDGSGGYGGGIFCSNASPIIRDCRIESNQAKHSGAGVHAEYGGRLMLSGCTLMNNQVTAGRGGGICLWYADGALSHCLIAGSHSADAGAALFLDHSETSICDCTIAENVAEREGGGVRFSLGKLSLKDTILWDNRALDGSQIAILSWVGFCDSPPNSFALTGVVDILACDIHGGQSRVYIGGDPRCLQFNWGTDNIDADPLFVDSTSGDYHLKSQAGRWEAIGQTWVTDDVTSPCIDAGDPNSPVGDEPQPNGGRVNMGAYGGTAEASKSYSGQ